jgi:hypothetical protein
MLLQSHKSFNTMADYDPVTGTFVTFSRSSEPARASGKKAGAFDDIGGKRALLFRLAGVLYLQVENQRMQMDDHAIELQSVHGRRVLQVFSDGKVVLELTYDPPILDPPRAMDPTPFVEEEDFDFGLLLSNLSRDRSRQSRMYTGL